MAAAAQTFTIQLNSSTAERTSESEERYREVVARLKRLLDVERRNLRAVRH